MSTLLVESGSTKTDWCFLQKGKRDVHKQTSGINPNLQQTEDILDLLGKELKWDHKKYVPKEVIYYGAGTGNNSNRQILKDTLSSHFKTKKIAIKTDLTAASRALCGNEKGIVCILGTGSNACYYDGKKIKEKQPSLGFIAGDEGSGNYMGKRVLQYYAYNTFDGELHHAFEQYFGNSLPDIIQNLYKKPFPNRYLAGFVELLQKHRGHFMVENIIEDCLNDFFRYHILKLRKSWTLPIHFTGSVAYEFRDVITDLCNQYELELGRIHKSPLKGLIQYHKDA